MMSYLKKNIKYKHFLKIKWIKLKKIFFRLILQLKVFMYLTTNIIYRITHMFTQDYFSVPSEKVVSIIPINK